MRYCLCILFNISLLSGLLAFDQKKVDSLTSVLEKDLNDDQKVAVLIELSKAHYYYNAIKGLEYARKALSLSQKTGNKKQEANAYYTIAINNFYLNRYDEAITYTQKAKKIFMQLKQEEDHIKALNTIGALYYKKEQHDVAYRYYDTVIIMSERTGNASMLTKAYHNKAMINQDVGEYSEAIKWFRLSLKLEKDSVGMAETYNSIGLIYNEMIETNLNNDQNKEFIDESLTYFNKALNIYKKEKHEKGLDRVNHNIGECYQKVGELKKALKFFYKSLKYAQKTNDSTSIFQSFISLSKVNKMLGKNEATQLMSYVRALEAAKDRKDRKAEYQLHEMIADILIAEGKFNLALQEHLLLVWEQNKENDKLLSDIGKKISDCYFKINNYKKAHYYLNETLNHKKISEKANQRNKLKALTFKEAINKEIALRKKEKELAENTQFYTGLAVVIALIIASIIYFLYNQKKKLNVKLSDRARMIEQQKKDIEDSIIYAGRIQHAMLPFIPDNPTMEEIPQYLVDNMKEGFIIHKPKDIVSGDFYYTNMTPEGKLIWLVGDCTGHGVPGAFMSILGNSLLNEVINEKRISEPSWILEELRSKIISTLNQKGEFGESRDGMDMALCIIDKNKGKLTFAGAYNPLYLIRKGELLEYKADNQPVGYHTGELKPFTQIEIQMEEGDAFYIFSDGYADQFGGPKGKKFMTKRFKKLLVEVSDKHMNDQREILIKTIVQWMEEGGEEQVDDICILGFRA